VSTFLFSAAIITVNRISQDFLQTRIIWTGVVSKKRNGQRKNEKDREKTK
jgi:hypothetical protein